jgi:Zn-dependent protease/predicted transcriptional regulator
MKAQIKLGRIFGVEIGLHYSWFLIALLITFSLAGHFQTNNPTWSAGLRWGVSILTAVLFFASIVVHELSHALVAKLRGLPVASITSFVIGVVCLVITIALGWKPPEFPRQPLPAMLMWLGYINIGLAIFNMIPGFPLDGGRVLRGLIWWITGNAKRATTIAARVGQVIAFMMIIYGVFQFFGGTGFSGLWLTFIGWFLLSASRESYAQMVITEGLRGLRVADVMSRDYPVVDAYVNLQMFADEHLTRSGRRFFVVSLNGRPEGIITPTEINTVPRNRWPYTTVADVMRPLDSTRTVAPNTSVTEALELMARQDLNQLPVVSEGGLAGLISRAHILQLIQTRAELHL